MSKYIIPFTKKGFDEIKKEYEELLQNRPQIVRNLSIARDMGDRSENAAYKEARRKLSSTDSRLRFLKRIVEHAQIVNPTDNSIVEIGSTVIVNNGQQDLTFYIVGEYEADPMNKKISYKSPVGQALYKKKVGDNCEAQIPSGNITYKIITIS